jgi:large subunit ribosomal protein L6
VSRIGRLPVEIPGGVQVELKGSDVRVKGPKGELQRTFSPQIGIKMENNHLVITRNSEDPAERALHGTTRAVLANMVHGVSKGFEVVLEVEGVGYRAEMEGKNLALFVGYSHPVKVEPPEGTRVSMSAAKPVRPGKEPSKPWRISLVLLLVNAAIRASASSYLAQRSARA